MADILFSTVERMHVGRPWGRLLDAGTGVHSLQWIQNLPTSSWTAITADIRMKQQIEANPSVFIRPNVDSLVVGNWMDDNFCSTLGKYDTILADYLIGAVDGFSPYEQDTIIGRLADHLNPQGRLYFVGMNPIPDTTEYPASIVSEVRRARDSCILLAGHRPYREFPLSWMKRHLERFNFRIIKSKNFTIMHSEDSIRRQLRVAQSKLPLMGSHPLRNGMDIYLKNIDERIRTCIQASSSGRIPLSFDYVIGAELVSGDAATGGAALGEGDGSMLMREVGADGEDVPDSVLLEALQTLDDGVALDVGGDGDTARMDGPR